MRTPLSVRSPSKRWSRTLSIATAGAALAASYTATVGTGAAAPPTSCGVNLGAPQVIQAVRSLPPYEGTDWAWSVDQATFGGNFNPCATLSTALVTVEGATGSSPITALMFHDGTYLGTATSKAYAFTSLNERRTTDDTVVLNYKDGRNVCTACEAPVNSVRYQWQGDHVAMLDLAPPG
jgi:hypothetical protein